MFAPTLSAFRVLLPFALAWFVGSVATPSFADVATPPQDAPLLTPEKIYLRAIHAMRELPQPAFVTFREPVAGRVNELRTARSSASVTGARPPYTTCRFARATPAR